MEPGMETDWVAFLGASYFRSAGALDQYGLSARGIAIDTATPRPEEFPRFTKFWLEPGADGVQTVYALLDGPSITGAYRMILHKGEAVVMDITKMLFAREEIGRLGVAPLTSMFWYSEISRPQNVDWRPEIHDSDGLAIWTGEGERIWRPLNNPREVQTSSFMDTNPRGFGLLQRDRDFENYQDDGVFYERRPSVWVEPQGDWGAGAVQLVEIPTEDEIHDNIAAYWVPEGAVTAGRRLTYSYRLHWVAEEPYPAAGRVVATRLGEGGRPGQPRPPHSYKFVIDFAGGRLAELDREQKVEPVVETSRGEIIRPYTLPPVGTDRWRAFFDIHVKGQEAVELRCYLRLGDEALTETWLYRFFPA
jgi:glucans biosynthesis protein